MMRMSSNAKCWALFVFSFILFLPVWASAQSGISLAGVHWYSGDSGLLDMSIPAGQRGWNLEAIYDSAGGGGSVRGNAQRAKDHGLVNIIRIDYRNYQAVPKNPAEFERWTNDFNRCIADLRDLASIFIVGNEPNLEGEITPQQYADAFNYLYARKPQGVSILVAGPSGFSPPQWLGDVSNRISGTDGFALHTYGDPTSVDLNTGRPCEDPRQTCKRTRDWNFDGGFQYFRDLINQIPSRFWSKPIYFTEFNTDVNGTKKKRERNSCVDRHEGFPDPIDNYKVGWINNAFQAIRDYNATRGAKPQIKALIWYVDRDDSGGCEWAGFALRNMPAARSDISREFKNPANRGGPIIDPPPDGCIASVSSGRWKGEYFNGRTLGSSPVMVRDDTAEMGKASGLAKNWGSGGPNRCGIGADEFSVRWTRRVAFEAGTYEFLLNSDDGTKLFLNDQEIISNWFDQGGGETRTVRRDLQAGEYTVKLEFYENKGGALVDLRWNKVASPQPPSVSLSTGWEDGEPQGLANQIMYSQKVSGTQCQRASGISRSGNYSFMIKGTYETGYAFCYHRIFDVNIPITSGTKIGYWIYQAEGTRQIGIDGHLDNNETLRDFNRGAIKDQNGIPVHPAAPRGVMNQWHYVEVDLSPAAGRTLRTLLLAFDKGNTPNQGSYRAYIDELRVFTGSTPPSDGCIASVSSGRWKGEYFNGRTLGSSPVMVRDDTAEMGKANGLAKNWGSGGPNRCGIGADEFSVRWTRRVAFEAGTYEFLLNSDDGTKLFLNDREIISNWIDQDGSQTRKQSVDFPQAGEHTVKLEFYENKGGALVDLRWNKVTPQQPSITHPLKILNGQSAGGVSAGLWITQCTREGWQRVWRVNSSRDQAAFQYTEPNRDCGAPGPFGIYPLVFRDANVQSGTWITWCTGNNNDQFVWQADGTRFAPFKWPESNAGCSTPSNPDPIRPQGKSKLTIHTEWDPGQRSWDFINTAKPAVVKLMSNTGMAQEIKRISPNTLVVGRIYLPSQPMGGDPRQRALDWWNTVKDRILASPHVDYWEGYNEPGNLNRTEMQWYAQFEVERVRILAQHNRKACIGNFAEGNPDVTNPDIWPAFYPAIDEALRHGGVLGLHEYSAPNMQHGFDERTGEGWHTGRYRKVYRQFLIPAGKKIPLIITECGIDGGANRSAPKPYCQGDGWRCYQKATEYFDQLKWYDNILKQDDYVLGATIFTLDQSGNLWDTFEIDDDTLLRLLKDHVK